MKYIDNPRLHWFNGISTFVGYLLSKPFLEKNGSGTI